MIKSFLVIRNKAFVNNKWIDSEKGEVINVTNPATGKVIGIVPKLSKDEINKAIFFAEKALVKWGEKTAKYRSELLRKWYSLILENIDDLALLMTLEQGKPLSESKGEISYAASFIDWFSEEIKRNYGDIIPATSEGKRILTIKQPVGVVAAITPWNFPSAMITRKAAPAIGSGCSIVIKPSSDAPFSALALAHLAKEAGFPEGIFNVVTGDSAVVGKELTLSNKVRKISFTGSTRVGKILMQQSASTIKKMSLELGGNAPFIVFADADIDSAVSGLIFSKFRNAGQTCICPNRVYLESEIYDVFITKLVEKVKKLKLGNGLNKNVDIGPLINKKAVEKVISHINDALDKGAVIHMGTNKVSDIGENYLEPVILSGVTIDMLVYKEETFGPVISISKFDNDNEVISSANNSTLGLASYIYSGSMKRIWKVSEALETGMVGVNTGSISTEVAPFGGVKESGLGREGSKYGLDEYTETKYICMDIS